MTDYSSPLPRTESGSTARTIGDDITRFRAVVRGQPITIALVIFGFGYLLGHLASPRRRRSWSD